MSHRPSPNDALLAAFMMNLAHKRAHLEDLSTRLDAFRQQTEALGFWKQFASVGFDINRLDPNDPSNAQQRPENTEYGE